MRLVRLANEVKELVRSLLTCLPIQVSNPGPLFLKRKGKQMTDDTTVKTEKETLRG